MIEIELWDEEWHRGEGGSNSRLRRADGKRCCMGVACRVAGVGDGELAGGAVSPGYIRDLSVGVKLPEWLEPTREWKGGHPVYLANDSDTTDDNAKVTTINKETEPLGFRFVYKGSREAK